MRFEIPLIRHLYGTLLRQILHVPTVFLSDYNVSDIDMQIGLGTSTEIDIFAHRISIDTGNGFSIFSVYNAYTGHSMANQFISLDFIKAYIRIYGEWMEK